MVTPPKIGMDNVAAPTLGTSRVQAEILVLALVAALAAEESVMIGHGKKERRGHPSSCLT